ncbi:DUF461 domain-containing protein [Streptomyces cylindrosporus]|uniref:DUF461 domain-containing protein n=1 Tax=Streptomyces cylindrosporus TaxID=2927583 RepID=A0ABS9Y4G5_9ACTN|nr:DUF461 domain-containing protein [Streptomyces cylindrosporus]MCI3272105.1 DUF461 domain-containing protein [Streptomyces cylindrosporus]
MSSSLRRGALAAAAIAFSIASLAACAAGSDAQTLQVKPDNAAVTVGDIKVQNALIITQPDREATGPAVISATLFNNGATAQTVDSITLPNVSETAEVKPAKGNGKLVVPAHGSVVIGGKGNASAVLPNGREAVQDGSVRQVTFTFSKTGDVSLRAFVVPADSYFEKWGPSEIPTATPSTTPKPGKSGATGSPNPSNSASTSATPTSSASESATTNQ